MQHSLKHTPQNNGDSGSRDDIRVSAFENKDTSLNGGQQASESSGAQSGHTSPSWAHLIRYLSAESPYRELSPNIPKDITEEEIERVFYLDEEIKRSIQRSADIDAALNALRNDHDQFLD